MIVVYFILFGFLGGILGGMGMGGGTILIPFLTIFLSVEQKVAQLTNLLVFLPMAFFALYFHFVNKMIHLKDVLYIIVPGLLSAILFSYLASLIDGLILRKIFGGFLIVIAFYEAFCMLYDKIKKNKKNE